ncbi:hypothetical protein ACVOMV_31220 [Mesorhizobium atlanticum]
MATVAAFAMRALPRRTLALLVMAVLICWSRLHVGIHYAGDVAGGAATGVAAASRCGLAIARIHGWMPSPRGSFRLERFTVSRRRRTALSLYFDAIPDGKLLTLSWNCSRGQGLRPPPP